VFFDFAFARQGLSADVFPTMQLDSTCSIPWQKDLASAERFSGQLAVKFNVLADNTVSQRERDVCGVSEVIPAELFEGGRRERCCHRPSRRHSEGWSCRERCILGSTGSASREGDTSRRNPQI